ncbi:DNA primase [Acholeplasma hippikon]|nr:DNA primase [Acholeplasma hippikon]
MENSVIQRINEETDIVALASEFMSLTKRGKNYMGLCPFHDEKTPSFSVSPEKHLAKCMGCGKGGNPITFYQQIKNISFKEAATDLAKRLGIEVKEEKKQVDPNERLYALMKDTNEFYQFALMNSEAGNEAYKYLLNRGLTDEDIKHFEIGFSPSKPDGLYQLLKSKKHSVTDMMALGLVKQNEEGIYYDVFRSRIMFPIKDEHDRVVGFSGRTTQKDEVAKYVNSTETVLFKKGEIVYHYLESKRAAVKQKHVILAEGFFDVIASYKSGLEAVVATMGTALTTHQAELIKRLTDHVVIAYDGDKAGQNATLKAIPVLRKAGLKISILSLPEKLDPDEYTKKYGYEKYKALYDTNLTDPYLFGYNMFIKNKDFQRADDILEFKKQMTALLRGADNTVLEYYQRKIFNELKIKVYLTDTITELPPKKKEELKVIRSKGYFAFEHLLINLLIEDKYLDKIRYYISLVEIHDKDQKELFKDIVNYYEITNESMMDIENFLAHYAKNKVYVQKFMDRIEFQRKMTIRSDKEFMKFVDAVKEYENFLLLETYKKKLVETQLDNEKNSYLEKIHELSKRGKVA